MALELGALSGADSHEGDEIATQLGAYMEAEEMRSGRIFESHEFPGVDTGAAHQGAAASLFVVVLHKSIEGISRIASSQFMTELRAKEYVAGVVHHACPPLTMQDEHEYQQWHIHSSLLRHSVTSSLREHVDVG